MTGVQTCALPISLVLVNHFKYLGFTLTRDGSMHTAADKMADNLKLAIARVYRIGSSKGITHRKHAMSLLDFFFLFPGFLSLVLGLLEQLPFAFSSA